jgi:hypothetical protein
MKIEHLSHEEPFDVEENSHQRMLQQMALTELDDFVVN